LVGVDEVERLACGSTLRTVLIGTAPRQRFQQHACDIHASGTFISDQPLVAHSWLDAHEEAVKFIDGEIGSTVTATTDAINASETDCLAGI
jgi:hypothetical protein